MPVSRADGKRRVVLAGAKPGDVFDVRPQGVDRIVLVRLEPPPEPARMSRARCLRAIAAAPLTQETSWEALRRVTREP